MEATNRARVNSDAVVLVVNLSAGDDDVGAGANVEAISVLATVVIAIRVVDGHAGDGEARGAVDADSLNGRVLNVQVGDGRVGKVVSVEELGLGDATAATLAVPPASTVGVEGGAGGSLNGDARALDLEEWSVPLGVAPGGLALEDHLLRSLSV